MSFRAVMFDWRGTLVASLAKDAWVSEALSMLGRRPAPDLVRAILRAIAQANGNQDRLEAPGVDANADVHRRVYLDVFADAGLDRDLARALYAVESNFRYNPFAVDALQVLTALRRSGLRLAVVSDIHFDLRPAFAAAGMSELVDVFILSFEQAVQKPDPAMFTAALEALGVQPAEALMVGDRSGPDGSAVEQGVTTLLLPPLRQPDEERLHHVLALAGVGIRS